MCTIPVKGTRRHGHLPTSATLCAVPMPVPMTIVSRHCPGMDLRQLFFGTTEYVLFSTLVEIVPEPGDSPEYGQPVVSALWKEISGRLEPIT